QRLLAADAFAVEPLPALSATMIGFASARCGAGRRVTPPWLPQSAGSCLMIGSSPGCSTAQPLPLHGRLRRICGCIRMSASKKPRPEKDEELIASATRFLQAYAASATVKDA